MDMSLSNLIVHYRAYVQAFYFAIVIWPFLGWIAMRRGADLRLFSLVPLILGGAVASQIALDAIISLALSGRGFGAIAAGLADSCRAPLRASTLSAALAGAIAVFPAFEESRRRRSVTTSVVFVFVLIGVALNAIQFLRLRTATAFTPAWGYFAYVALGMNLAVLLPAVLFTFVPQRRMTGGSGRGWFLALAATGALIAILLLVLMAQLRLFATHGG
jgi:hypothetical protein